MPTPYDNAINSEGILQYYLAQLAAQDAAAKSQRDAAIAALQGDYNGAGNPYSQVAQMQRQRRLSRGNLRAQLAARGAIQSGEYALGEGDIGYNYGLQNYQAARSLSQQIADLQSQYAQGAAGRLDQQRDLYGEAIGRLQQGGVSPTPAKVPGPAPYGYYKDKNGVLTPKGKPKKNLIYKGGATISKNGWGYR